MSSSVMSEDEVQKVMLFLLSYFFVAEELYGLSRQYGLVVREEGKEVDNKLWFLG